MGLVATWLSGIGLSHAIPSFKAAGIVTPSALAELDLIHYEALGVTEASDRRKLFYLVQRIKMAVDQSENDEEVSKVDDVISKTLRSTPALVLDENDSLRQHESHDNVLIVTETKKSAPKEQQVKRQSRRIATTRREPMDIVATEDDPVSKSVSSRSAPSSPSNRIMKETRTRTSRNADDPVSKSVSSRNAPSSPGNRTMNETRTRTSRNADDPISKSVSSRSAPSSPSNRSMNETRARAGRNASRTIKTEEKGDVSKLDERDWDMDGSEQSADDEATTRPAQRRTSRRLQEKRHEGDSGVSLPSTRETEPDDKGEDYNFMSASTRQAVRPRSNSAGSARNAPPLPRRQSTEAATSRRRSGSSHLDSDDDSTSSGQPLRTSGMPKPRTRRYESKIQNPGASARTGKQLSTIPAGSVAPMSPLVALPVSRLDADISRQRKIEEKKASVSTTRSITGRARAISLDRGSQSGSESESGRRVAKTSSASDSDTTNPRKSSRQSLGSVGTQRKSLGSESSRPRRSLGGSSRSGTTSIQKPNSLRDVRASQSVDASRRPSLPASKKGGNEAASNSGTAPKGPVFVHGMPEDNSWAAQVMQLRDDNQAEHELFAGHVMRVDDEEMRIRVIIRKRPMSEKESATGKEVDVIHPLEYDTYGRILVYQPKTRVDLTKEIETVPFAFDNVFDEASNNAQIYHSTVRNLIPGVFQGNWASVFAYGQTGSGKTFTMMGCNLTGVKAGSARVEEENLGLYYMAALDVFAMLNEPAYRHLTVGASLFEIYGGKLFDLLNARKAVKCLEDHRGKVCFPGLSEHPVGNARELMSVIEAGAINRSTGSTSKNADSSRSHAVLRLSLRKDMGRQKNVEHGRLTFIDLAGSERGADTNNASRATRLEGAEINTSLLALKEVIRALATGDSMAHIPFRGSKLTQVLKESFVGKNSRSVMVACIAPNMSNCEHTLNTLRYADRVKERNSETGNLSATIANNRRGSKQLSRASSAPMELAVSEAGNADDFEDDAIHIYELSTPHTSDAFEDELIDNHDLATPETSNTYVFDDAVNDDQDFDDFSDNEKDSDREVVRNYNFEDNSTVNDSGSDLLEDLLTSPIDPGPALSTARDRLHRGAMRSADSQKSAGSRGSQRTPTESLISIHRSIMSEMLGMVKHEMTLVNKADADRDTIDEYMEELDSIHKKQLSLISSLRESLMDYYGSRGTEEVPSPSLDILMDDDSFEDLRD